jgi:hypothetical protein
VAIPIDAPADIAWKNTLSTMRVAIRAGVPNHPGPHAAGAFYSRRESEVAPPGTVTRRRRGVDADIARNG